ncbi:MAG: HNH endonuclease [Actinobacteria bacterium]|nr:HNH endonuclease [Actinomycetota bacterium]
MFDKVRTLREAVGREVEGLEPALIHAPDAARLLAEFSRIEKLASAAVTLLAPRAADSGAWRSAGERSAAHWMARTTGVSVGQAVTTLETGAALAELPAAADALRSGQLSSRQAAEIASAASAAPGSEASLVRTAAVEGLAGLRERCRQVKAAALPDENRRYELVRRSRRLRHWTDPDGAFRMDLLTTPDAGAEILAALEPHRQRAFDEARRCGRREGHDAYMADALRSLARGESSKPPAKVQVRADHLAFVRGHTVDGEICEIAGVGPVPVATARAYALDGFVAVVGVKDADVTAVAHLGRTIPARLRTALEARDPCCDVPGCPVHEDLEIDHVIPFAEGGPTILENLARLCRWHHYLKTHRGYRLEGGPGAWRWVPPRDRPDTS